MEGDAMSFHPDRPGPFRPWRAAACVGVMLTAAVASRAAEPARAGPPSVTWDEAAARHLLSRACFGGTPEEARALAARPLPEAVREILDKAAAAKPPARPDWVRNTWVNFNRRYSDMTAEEYLVILRR